MRKSLEPIFILGFPRSGTTALARAIGAAQGISEFASEGHFFYFWSGGIRRVIKGRLNPASFVNSDENRELFLDELALFYDRVYRKALATDERWVDKTPDLHQIRSVDVIRRVFPKAVFLFTYRTPEEAIRSNIAQWPEIAPDYEAVVRRWIDSHKAWRQRRRKLPADNVLEIFQPDMLADPVALADDFARVLRIPGGEARKITGFLKRHPKLNRPKVGERADEYDAVTLTSIMRARIAEMTRDERSHWPKLAD